MAAGLEKGPHSLEVLSPQEPLVGLEAEGLRGSLNILSRARISAHCSHLLIGGSALSSGNQLLLLGPGGYN